MKRVTVALVIIIAAVFMGCSVSNATPFTLLDSLVDIEGNVLNDSRTFELSHFTGLLIFDVAYTGVDPATLESDPEIIHNPDFLQVDLDLVGMVAMNFNLIPFDPVSPADLSSTYFSRGADHIRFSFPLQDATGILAFTLFADDLFPNSTQVTVDFPVTQPIPEPGTILLIGSGLSGLAVFRLWRKKQA